MIDDPEEEAFRDLERKLRKKKKYSVEYDAYYNSETNQWLEDKCSDPYCEYCENRPDKPL
jgi:hypothetical protein